MAKVKYPIKLDANVLVDVVFEIRFDAKNGFSEFVPSAARKLFGDVKDIERLPIAEIPSQVRASDMNLKYQPTMRMVWDDVVLVLSDHSLGLGYGERYAGWVEFKRQIDRLLKCLHDEELSSMITSVTRYSFKYIDFIPQEYYSDINNPFKIKIELNNQERSDKKFKLDFEVQENFGVSFFEFATPVAQMNDKGECINKGTLLSIDTVRVLSNPLTLDDSLHDINEFREIMHEKNKGFFFDALSDKLLKKLGAQYD